MQTKNIQQELAELLSSGPATHANISVTQKFGSATINRQ
jgi:hypothetical protein